MCSFPDVGLPCQDHLCYNGGVCRRQGSTLSYPCQCNPGFTGDVCEFGTGASPPSPMFPPQQPPPPPPPPSSPPSPPSQGCFPNSCNGGRCTSFVGGFICTDCPEGFSGQFCHIQTGEALLCFRLSKAVVAIRLQLLFKLPKYLRFTVLDVYVCLAAAYSCTSCCRRSVYAQPVSERHGLFSHGQRARSARLCVWL